MSRNYEIKNQNLIETKPYLTKKELELLLEIQGKNLDKKISLLQRDGYLLPLKKGLYTTKIYTLENHIELLNEFFANIIYYPSYLSLEYVLAQENLIPESIYSYTSISLKTTRNFSNRLGNFNYRKIKTSLFTGFVQKDYAGKYKIKVASRAKALFDYLYLRSWRSYANDLYGLRINWDNISQDDMNEFLSYVDLAKSKKMSSVYLLIKSTYDYQ